MGQNLQPGLGVVFVNHIPKSKLNCKRKHVMKIEEAWIDTSGRNPEAREEWGVAIEEWGVAREERGRRGQRAEVIGLSSTLTQETCGSSEKADCSKVPPKSSLRDVCRKVQLRVKTWQKQPLLPHEMQQEKKNPWIYKLWRGTSLSPKDTSCRGSHLGRRFSANQEGGIQVPAEMEMGMTGDGLAPEMENVYQLATAA